MSNILFKILANKTPENDLELADIDAKSGENADRLRIKKKLLPQLALAYILIFFGVYFGVAYFFDWLGFTLTIKSALISAFFSRGASDSFNLIYLLDMVIAYFASKYLPLPYFRWKSRQ